MSVIVLFNGKRQGVKVPNANAFVTSIIEDALSAFKLPSSDASSYVLKHKGKIVDRGQPFRYCNIPNNAVLDLEFIANTRNNYSLKETKVALTTEIAGSLIATFDGSTSLHDVLDYFILRGDLDSSVLSRSPEVIYVRNSFANEDLNKTLQSLGLEGQSVRFQLRLGAAAPLPPMQVAAAALSSRSSLSPNSIIEDKLAYAKASDRNETDDSTFYSKSSSGFLSNSGAYLRSLRESGPAERELRIAEEKTVPSGRSPLTVPMAIDSEEVTSSNYNNNNKNNSSSFDDGLYEGGGRRSPPSPKIIMNEILAANFDAVSIPAVVTMAKYVYNILSDPTDERFQSINTANKTFKEKVLVAKGASNFLDAIGFVPRSSLQGVSLHLEALGGSSSISQQMASARTLLDDAMDKLSVQHKDRPVLRVATISSSSSGAAPVTFDPFKTTLTRTAPQPRDNSSLTDRKLEHLLDKRRELEGRIEDVARQTELLMPSADGSVPNIQDFSIDAGVTIDGGAAAVDEDAAVGGDSRLLAATIKSLLQQASTDAPLKTKAMRDLEKMQSSRVYSKSLVRVRFPDRVCIQGYFHPRNLVSDLYTWAHECLGANGRPFELYTSPPKVVLPRDKSLAELLLVPAALIHLSWVGVGAAEAGTSNASLGFYLCDRLLLQSSYKEGSSTSFPVGEQLEGKAVAAAPRQHVAEGTADGGESKADSKSGKPKWLKLGHK